MGVVWLKVSDARRLDLWSNWIRLRSALVIVIIVIAVLIIGFTSGRYLYSNNAESQIFTGKVLKVGVQGSEACFAYRIGSTKTRACNQLFTSGVSIHENEIVTFLIAALHQGGITSHGFVVLNP